MKFKLLLATLLTFVFWIVYGSYLIVGTPSLPASSQFFYVIVSVVLYSSIHTVNYFLVASVPGFWFSMFSMYFLINYSNGESSDVIVFCRELLIFTLIPVALAIMKHRKLRINDLSGRRTIDCGIKTEKTSMFEINGHELKNFNLPYAFIYPSENIMLYVLNEYMEIAGESLDGVKIIYSEINKRSILFSFFGKTFYTFYDGKTGEKLFELRKSFFSLRVYIGNESFRLSVMNEHSYKNIKFRILRDRVEITECAYPTKIGVSIAYCAWLEMKRSCYEGV